MHLSLQVQFSHRTNKVCKVILEASIDFPNSMGYNLHCECLHCSKCSHGTRTKLNNSSHLGSLRSRFPWQYGFNIIFVNSSVIASVAIKLTKLYSSSHLENICSWSVSLKICGFNILLNALIVASVVIELNCLIRVILKCSIVDFPEIWVKLWTPLSLQV